VDVWTERILALRGKVEKIQEEIQQVDGDDREITHGLGMCYV